jgi:hypothetical protein
MIAAPPNGYMVELYIHKGGIYIEARKMG